MVLRSGSVNSNSIGPPLDDAASLTAAQSVVPQLTRYTPDAVNVHAPVDVDKHVAPVLANLSQYVDSLELISTHLPESFDLMHPTHVALPYRPNIGSPHKETGTSYTFDQPPTAKLRVASDRAALRRCAMLHVADGDAA